VVDELVKVFYIATYLLRSIEENARTYILEIVGEPQPCTSVLSLVYFILVVVGLKTPGPYR
jgi:hypothetical protein